MGIFTKNKYLILAELKQVYKEVKQVKRGGFGNGCKGICGVKIPVRKCKEKKYIKF
jgi:hypothetical protein